MKKVICTICPLSCEVELLFDKEVIEVRGNKCPRGKRYAIKEHESPERTLTTTLRVEEGAYPLLPVRTDRPIPKELLLPAMRHIQGLRVQAPIVMGDVILPHLLQTEANLVASRSLKRGEEKGL